MGKRERKGRNQFPRRADLPAQSPRYWASEKDRYLRQLLISDIEEETGRELVVYFCRTDQSITQPDADDFLEILDGVEGIEKDGRTCKEIDLMIHTLGGMVDAVEKFNTVLRAASCDARVIIPSFAKSGGTLIALAAETILMGVNSELGPIDPQIDIPDLGIVPAQYVKDDESQPHTYREIAASMFKGAQTLAAKYLKEGMLKELEPGEIGKVVEKLSSADGYGSHGAVIDFCEATELGLNVGWMAPESALWKRVWLLHCMYEVDVKKNNLGKIFEGAIYSLQRQPE